MSISVRDEIPFAVPVETAFDYLADPRHRPEWQSSLKRVRLLDDGPPREGQRWIDETAVGIRPRMEITELDRPRRWAEVGTWRGISARLLLEFAPAGPSACTVLSTMSVRGRGPLLPVGLAATVLGRYAVRADLRQAARLLAR